MNNIYHILEDGTVVNSRHNLNVGERYQKPGTAQFLKIKFANISNEDYTIVHENARTIAADWEAEKALVLKARTGWNSVSQKGVMEKLYAKYVLSGEPLQKESYFVAMKSFK